MKLTSICNHSISLLKMTALSAAMLATASVAQAGSSDTQVCQDLEKAERGLCTAAVRSGCALDGRNTESIHCAKLESNYRKVSGGNMPVWLMNSNSGGANEEGLIP